MLTNIFSEHAVIEPSGGHCAEWHNRKYASEAENLNFDSDNIIDIIEKGPAYRQPDQMVAFCDFWRASSKICHHATNPSLWTVIVST